MRAYSYLLILLTLSFTIWNTLWNLCHQSKSQWLASSSLPEPEIILKTFTNMGAAGWLWWSRRLYRVNLSLFLIPKHSRETTFCENQRPCKRIYFWHSFWKTLYIAYSVWTIPCKECTCNAVYTQCEQSLLKNVLVIHCVLSVNNPFSRM